MQDFTDLNNISLNRVRSQDLVHIMPITKIEVAESNTAKKTTRNNMSIVPNDRDIPIFLEHHDDEEQYNLSHKSRNLKSK